MRPASDDSPRVGSPRVAPPEYQLTHSAIGADETRSASLRLRSLASLSGSLTDALTPEDAASLIELKALSALGATSAVVVTLGQFPPSHTPTAQPQKAQAQKAQAQKAQAQKAQAQKAQAQKARAPRVAPSLVLVHAIGVPAEIRAELERLPLDAPIPLAEVARTGKAVFLHSADELRRYPEWSTAMIRVGTRAAAIVPVWANGELRGVLGLTWKTPRTFDEDERAYVSTLGVMCAQAIMRAHLRMAEQRARETAEHANRSKAHFLATISHELRTPLNAVMGYTQLLVEEIYGPVSALQKDHLGRVRASGMHLLDLVEDLLSYARIEAGEEHVRAARVLMAEVVEQSLVLVRPLADRKGLEIRVEGDTAPVELFTDARKLSQILVNLLANATKYTDSGDIVLVMRVEGVDANARVIFEVSDTGRGIAVKNHEHVFDAFWQEDRSMTHTVGSTGLGLSVARELARLLGGDVLLARSKVARGSTFVVSLPIRYDATAPRSDTGLR